MKKKINLKEVLTLIGITVGILFFSYPAVISHDIFNYLTTSKVLFFYNENPYVVMPIEFIGEPFLSFTRASNKIALYGPIWIFLSGIPYVLGIGNFLVTLFNFKLLIAIFYLVTTFLIWKISRNIISVILFAFNPLIAMETLVSGHNDIVMIFLALLSFFLLSKKKIFFAIVIFILSILIKYATVLLTPVFIYILWKIIRKKSVDWRAIFYYAAIIMCVGFLLAPLREEIYPWYSIWFLPFVFLIPNKKILVYSSIILSFSLLFRYVPFMFSGTHAGATPVIKTAITFIPIGLVLCYFIVIKLWQKIYYR